MCQGFGYRSLGSSGNLVSLTYSSAIHPSVYRGNHLLVTSYDPSVITFLGRFRSISLGANKSKFLFWREGLIASCNGVSETHRGPRIYLGICIP